MKQVDIEWLMAHGEFASGEVLPSEKVTIHFYSWKNRVAKLEKYSFGPRSCLAASLAEFELFIHEPCMFALPHTKIQSCHCSHSTKSMFKVMRPEALSADVATVVAIL